MDPIIKLAEKYNLKIIEDNAQAIGCKYTFPNGDIKFTGTLGHIGTTSFYPSKNLGCYGDGGAIFTNDDILAEKIRMIVNHGEKIKYHHEIIGCNSRLDSIQAEILSIKLKYLDEYNANRKIMANNYNLAFSGIEQIQVPRLIDSSEHVYHQYTLRIKNGFLTMLGNEPKYNILGDAMANRTFEESGDYIVTGNKIRVREHLKSGNNNGVFASGSGGNNDLLSVDIGPGLAYVRGFRIDNKEVQHVEVRKGTDTVTKEDELVSANYGNYVNVREVSGAWDLNGHDRVELYNSKQFSVSNNGLANTTFNGSVLGRARVRGIEYSSGQKGSKDALYKLYLYDIKMTANTFNNVRSIGHASAVGASGKADTVLVNSNTVLNDTSFSRSIFELPSRYIKTVKDAKAAGLQKGFNDLEDWQWQELYQTGLALEQSVQERIAGLAGEALHGSTFFGVFTVKEAQNAFFKSNLFLFDKHIKHRPDISPRFSSGGRFHAFTLCGFFSGFCGL